jgi:hypothetical protein
MDANQLPVYLLGSPLLVILFCCGSILQAESPRQGLLNEGPAMLRRVFRQHSSCCDGTPCDAGSCSVTETFPVVTREAPSHNGSNKPLPRPSRSPKISHPQPALQEPTPIDSLDQPTPNSILDPPSFPDTLRTPPRIPAPRVIEPIRKDKFDIPEVGQGDDQTNPFLDDQVRATPSRRIPLIDPVIIRQVSYESRGRRQILDREKHLSQTESITVISALPFDEDLFQVEQKGKYKESEEQPAQQPVSSFSEGLSYESRWMSPVYVR